MLYSKVYLNSFGYELPPNVVTSDDLEKRLEPVYDALHFQPGQLEAITGIRERRFWDPGTMPSDVATMAAEKAIADAGIDSEVQTKDRIVVRVFGLLDSRTEELLDRLGLGVGHAAVFPADEVRNWPPGLMDRLEKTGLLTKSAPAK